MGDNMICKICGKPFESWNMYPEDGSICPGCARDKFAQDAMDAMIEMQVIQEEIYWRNRGIHERRSEK